MDFIEFTRRLGAEPRSEDPEFVAARDATPENRQAAFEADAFEATLERAVRLPEPEDLMDVIGSVALRPATGPNVLRARWPWALAASLLVAVGAAGVTWQMNRSWESVEAYVMDHYRHDGEKIITRSLESPYGDVHEVLAEFGLDAAPQLAGIVSLVKFCPTPEGKGVHMILDTESGPVTVIYMPDAKVTDREMMAFDDREALLLTVEGGAAAIIASPAQHVEDFYAMVHDAIVRLQEPS